MQTSSAVCNVGASQATYQFVGQCTDCSGTGVGLLTLQGYTLGAALTGCNFVSFTYTSNLRSFTITQANVVSLTGTLPISLPATATVSVIGPGVEDLSSNVSGSWSVGASDYGSSSIWSLYSTPTPAAPAPSTAVLCALGLPCANLMV